MTTPRIWRLGAVVLMLGACREPAAGPVPAVEPVPTAVDPVVATTTAPTAKPVATAPTTPIDPAPPSPPADAPAEPPPDPPVDAAPVEPEAVVAGREFNPDDDASLDDLDAELPESTTTTSDRKHFPTRWMLDAGAPDPTHGPGLDSGDTIAEGYDTSDKMRWLAKKTLLEKSGAKVVVHAMGEIHRENGEVVVYALVEGNRRALCIAREGGDEGAPLRCDAALSTDTGATPKKKPCPEAQLAKVVIGPPGSAGKNARALELAAMVALPGRCKVVGDSAELALRDLDRDGRPEVLASWVATEPQWEQSRSGGRVEMSIDTEWLSIHRLDLRAQLVAQVGEAIENEESPSAEVVRVRLAPANDGIHRNVVVDARAGGSSACSGGGGECWVLERIQLAYAPTEDRWVAPETHLFVEERATDRR